MASVFQDDVQMVENLSIFIASYGNPTIPESCQWQLKVLQGEVVGVPQSGRHCVSSENFIFFAKALRRNNVLQSEFSNYTWIKWSEHPHSFPINEGLTADCLEAEASQSIGAPAFYRLRNWMRRAAHTLLHRGEKGVLFHQPLLRAPINCEKRGVFRNESKPSCRELLHCLTGARRQLHLLHSPVLNRLWGAGLPFPERPSANASLLVIAIGLFVETRTRD